MRTGTCEIGGRAALSRKEFQRLLDRERERADRTEVQFSVVLFDGEGLEAAGVAEVLLDVLTRSIRNIDDVGWFDNVRIAVLLPCTPPEGALKLIERVRVNWMPPNVTAFVYLYPGQWLPPEDGEGTGTSAESPRPERRGVYARNREEAVAPVVGAVCDRAETGIGIETRGHRERLQRLATEDAGRLRGAGLAVGVAEPEDGEEQSRTFCAVASATPVRKRSWDFNPCVHSIADSSMRRLITGEVTVHTRSMDALFERRLPVWKRTMDIGLSAAALVVLSPVLAAVAAIIAIVSPGPVFLRQKRVGYLGRPFTILKFRTMKPGSKISTHQEHFQALMAADAPLTKLDTAGDPRIIPLGNLIRGCCLDELPQLINVLRGDMTLVGPRPCLAFAVSQYLPWQRRRCDAVPGMTGLWQVSGKNKTTFKEMLRLDIAYVRKMSFLFDLRILLKTLPVVWSELRETLARRRAHAAGHYLNPRGV